jgi:invasion protein IalB
MPTRAVLLAALLAVSAAAPEAHRPHAPVVHAGGAAPHRLGRFNDWQAAAHLEGGTPTCYAFTRARRSTPRLPGRGDVVLSVTESRGGRERVAIAAGYAFPAGATASVEVKGERLGFYTAGRSAFARRGAEAIAAFLKGETARASLAAPRNVSVTDEFSLNGFGAALDAVRHTCPAT